MGRRSLVWHVARFSAAALLIVAGSLKLFVGSGPSGSGSLVLEPHVTTLLAAVELALGLWLAAGWSAAVARPVAVATFASFAGASAWLTWLGASECGCLGPLSVPPVVMASADLILAGLLAVGRTPARRPPDWGPIDFVRPAATALALGLGVYAFGVYHYGSAAAALAGLQGQAAHLEFAALDFGEGNKGDRQSKTVAVTNLTSRPVLITGGKADCSCTALADLPLTVPPHESRPLTISLRFVGSTPGRQVHEVTYTTDDPATPTLRLWVVASLKTPGVVPGE